MYSAEGTITVIDDERYDGSIRFSMQPYPGAEVEDWQEYDIERSHAHRDRFLKEAMVGDYISIDLYNYGNDISDFKIVNVDPRYLSARMDRLEKIFKLTPLDPTDYR